MISGILDLNQVSIADVIIHRKDIKSIDIDQDITDIIKQAFKINHTKFHYGAQIEIILFQS